MADESVLSVPGLGKLEYNLKHYMSYVTRIKDVVDELNKSKTGRRSAPWTGHDVEKALWTYHLAQKYDIQVTDQIKEKQASTKRANTADLDSSKPLKKRKK